MERRARRVSLSPEIRSRVKHEQGCRCFICKEQFEEHDLYIHHIQPVAHHRKGQGEYANRRENLVALCKPDHEWADSMALERGVYLNELIDMEEGIEYGLRVRK